MIKKKKGKQGYILAKCPTCGTWYLEQALKKHITQTAQRELARMFSNILEHARNEHTFSKQVALRQMPHYVFRSKHIRTKGVFEI